MLSGPSTSCPAVPLLPFHRLHAILPYSYISKQKRKLRSYHRPIKSETAFLRQCLQDGITLHQEHGLPAPKTDRLIAIVQAAITVWSLRHSIGNFTGRLRFFDFEERCRKLVFVPSRSSYHLGRYYRSIRWPYCTFRPHSWTLGARRHKIGDLCWTRRISGGRIIDGAWRVSRWRKRGVSRSTYDQGSTTNIQLDNLMLQH